MMPMSHARKVLTGIVVSSVLATAARTSGYGESSSALQYMLASSQRNGVNKLTKTLCINVEVGVVEIGNRRYLREL